MAASSSSSPSPPPPPYSSVTCMDGFTFDVFLSFRGKDTRYHFTSFLWKALEDKGIRTFFDKEDIRTGEEITKALPKAIEESRTAIVVLSPNYAESAFCLRELSHILDCIQGRGRVVWPVFYEVEPSDVRWSTGTYGKAMAEHEATSWYTPVQLQNWKNALQQVADLKGNRYYEWKNGINIYQYEFIDKIVKEVSKQIKPSTLFVTDYSVGLKQKKEEVISLLSNEKVHMVGIHGLGGIGKTTLAKEVYNFIASKFEGSCFLEKVTEHSKKHGLPSLQKILLSKTVGEKEMDITSVPDGITVLQQRLRHKKILLLLDDVDNTEQLNALIGPSVATAGRPEWFGLGSRVIITTRDIGLLERHAVENKYEVKGLDEKDALDLLRWKAFKSHDVSSGYDGVLNRAVKYASGLPLALEVIGSHLFKREIKYWNYTLEQYERSPHERIQAVLEVSYEALNKEQQSAFLDIACFFNGHTRAWVKKILHAHHGNRAEGHIGVLVEKSLIKIDESSNVTLHDLIEDMGKEIVQRDLLEEPGRRSRLWNPEDIVQILEENTGTSKIEVIHLDSQTKVNWDGEAFKRTKTLRTLVIEGGVHFSTSPKYLPNSLRILIWSEYPSSSLPPDFYPKNLAMCMLDHSEFTSIKGEVLFNKKFENMRILNLDQNTFLTHIPNVSGLPNLEELSFDDCDNLTTIDDSVGLHGKLKILSARGCRKLSSFPPLKLVSLQELYLSHCDGLESFPLVVDGLLGKLKILHAGYCRKLNSFPPLKLASLEKLYLTHCDSLDNFPLVVDGLLNKLKILRVNYCSKLKSFPPLKLASLEELDISHCVSLVSFPPVVDGLLPKLKILRAYSCVKLNGFPPLKLASLEQLYLSCCDSLESFPPMVDGSLDKLKILRANDCEKLKSFPTLKLASLEELDISNCHVLESFPPVVERFLGKLKILRANYCRKLSSFPPLNLASLEELHLSFCESLENFPPVVDGLLDRLKILHANYCENLSNFPPLKLAALEVLDISHCVSLKSFPPVVDGLLCKLKLLRAYNCVKLKSFPPLKLASLEELDISHCASLESFPPVVDWLLPKLKILRAYSVKLKGFPPLKLASLEQLYLSRCYDLESFPPVVDGLLGELKILRVEYCRKLKSFPPLKLASLEELYLSCCDSLESFPLMVDGSLDKLKILRANDCEKLKSFPPLKLASLEELDISYCHVLESFPPVVEGFLGKLKILRANYCRKLSSFPPLNLASLEELHLSFCESLENFPPVVDGLLDRLKILRANYCGKLSSFPPLKLASLEELDISHCVKLESFPPSMNELFGKLKIFRAYNCGKHRDSCLVNLKYFVHITAGSTGIFHPLKLASLEQLYLSCCDSLESFPPHLTSKFVSETLWDCSENRMRVKKKNESNAVFTSRVYSSSRLQPFRRILGNRSQVVC